MYKPEEMDIRWIQKMLPHRQPFLLLDRVLELKESESIVAIKNVTYNEPFFNGHFPEYPVMPGVLILEAMAQASALIAYTSPKAKHAPGQVIFFAGADEVRFRQPVVPGDQLRIEVQLLNFRKSFCKVSAKATVEGEIVCTATLMSFLKDINSDS
ncbi:MAG: fabZ [Gammaproteobacteria bacterium]|jgi:3-hydroxyacyl-[acyl-carrier-protein] dehydratase|nr:fabZ [Gammaproteobacteria bacterium]